MSRQFLAQAYFFDIGSTTVGAAALFRTCRRNGEPVRKLIDCLIAAVAARENVPILHADSDFDTLARHTPVRVVAP